MSSKSVPRVPTIITAVPQEPLIKVCEFKKSFDNHADDNTAIGGSSTNNGATATLPPIFAQDKARFDAAAARCDIQDEIEASNAPFSDPTLFGLLKEWHDFLVIKAHPHDEREEAVRMQMGVRPTWKSMHAPPGEGSDSGVVAGGSGSGMSLLAGGLTGGVRKGIDRMDDEGEEDEERVGPREGSVVPQTRRSQEKRPVATRIFFNTAGKAADTSNGSFSGSPLTSNEESLEQQASSSQSSTSATSSSKADSRIQRKKRAVSPPAARVPPVTKIKIIEEQNMARLQHYLTPKTGEDVKNQSGFLKTAIEINIEKILQGIASSPLATLNVDQRFEVPTSERPPINFRNVYIPPSRQPKAYRALTTQEQEDEVVLTVTIQSSTDPSRQMQEIKLLGSNTLMDLRNVLSCPSDFALLGHDEPPEDHPIQQQYRNTATSKPSNSMFCIESRFYIDNPLLHAKADKKRALVDEEYDRQARLRQQIHERLREVEQQGDEQQQQQQRTDLDPSGMEIDDDVSELRRQLNTVPPEVDLPIEQMDVEYEAELAEVSEDYSAPILEWAKKNPNIFPFGAVPTRHTMATTMLRSLEIRLRHPYLFVHQGQCEHIVYFQDLQLFNPQHHSFNRNEYPITTFMARHAQPRCKMCTNSSADYAAIDDILAETNPYYFCERCFNRFHYDVNGRPLFNDSIRVFRCRADLKQEVTSLAKQGELHLVAN